MATRPLAAWLRLFLLGFFFAPSFLVNIVVVLASPVLGSDDAQLLVRRSTPVPRYSRCKQKGQFAMTFDDGPLLGASTATLLEQYGGRGTYFVNGLNWDCLYNPARVADLIKRFQAGHVIGSHTWGHDDITTLTPEQLHRQLDLVETALWKILGVKPRLFRPPYGRYDRKSLQVLQERGYTVVLWDFDDRDTIGATPEQSIASYKQLLKSFPKPHIALNHETKEGTVNTVAPTVIPLIHGMGYKLVDMGQCLNVDPYQAVGTPSQRDSTWTCDGTPGPGQA
ncbi:hypothetical protein JCM10908_002358 [Rhodotorula pacifica]|uniref:uncharacterized protein n=1 Tax=Rhodotorula pacifica TaxID=1495444 RepID=UPI003172E208